MQYTRHVFSMSLAEQSELQERVRDKAHEFEYELFEQRFHHLVTTTEAFRPIKPIAKATLAAWRR